jgi:hypothetical protein
MKETEIDFRITKISQGGRIIQEINNRPAATELLCLLNWPEDILNEDTWFSTNYYFPFGFKRDIKKDAFYPRVIVGVFGESLISTIRSKEPNSIILTIDGNNLLKAVENNLSNQLKNPSFGLITSCITRIETLEEHSYIVWNYLNNYFNEAPFIKVYVGGESTYSEDKGLSFMNMSFNTAIFHK